ncbi:Signal transduction histidine kinase [Roseateles sp. YR242]|uniref:sensor histidine kinase n=1 Tax=Roseateles sp. YR242 TaxID=1855305 RepID=UPI0008B661AB|nr:sensor histidine kinase [Roseateles sp. YR242]SEK62801.1 Signal transduction histidine kinase [Roseateles sp. YR242]
MASVGSSPARAYAPDFNHSAWTELQGAPPDVIGIDQSKDGFLWLACAWGLVRFDGQRFERMGPEASAGSPPQPNASTLLVLADQSIWVAYRAGGADHYRPSDGTFTHYAAGMGLPAGRLFSFVEWHGEVWANAFEGLYRFRGGRWERISGTLGLPERAPNYLLKDGDGSLLLYVPGTGWLRLDRPGGTLRPFPTLRGELAQLDGRGGYWSADGPRSQLIHTSGQRKDWWPLPLDITADLLHDSRGDVWVSGFHRDGIAHFSANTLRDPVRAEGELLDARAGLSASSVLSLYEDRQRQVWVGTTLGIDRFAPKAVHPPPSSSTYGLPLPLPSGEILLVSRFAAPVLLDAALKPVPAPVPPARFDSAGGVGHTDRNGLVWIGGYDSLWKLQNRRLHNVPLPDGVHHRILQALGDMPDGSLWASFMDQGLWRLSGGQWSRVEDPLLGGQCTTLTNTPAGLLLGFTDGRLVEVSPGQVRALQSPDVHRLGRVMAIVSHGADVWVGNDRGIELVRDGVRRPLALAEGETVGLISGMVLDAAGDLWMNEAGGILHVGAAELARVAEDPSARLRVDRFGPHDGVRGALSPRGTPSLQLDSSGRLWATRGSDVLWFYPAELLVQQIPPAPRLLDVAVKSAPVNSSHGIEMRSGDFARVQFTAVDLHQAEAVRFRARIVGLQDDWQELGGRQLNFGGLPPGRYQVELQASAPRSAWGLGGTLRLPVVIIPNWYQTWTFRCCTALVLIGLLALIYRSRVRLVVRRAQERLHTQLNERERIARELHDHLLQGTIGLTLQVGQTARRLPADSPERSQLERALERAEQLLDDTREELRNLRSHQSHAPFDQELRRELGSLRAPQLPVIEVTTQGIARPVGMAVATQLRAVVIEAVRNAIKHASSARIDVTVCYEARQLRVSVQDHGAGLPAAGSAVVTSMGAGFGMAGMKERAGLIGGRLTWVSEPGRGTRVDILIPGRRAYPD